MHDHGLLSSFHRVLAPICNLKSSCLLSVFLSTSWSSELPPELPTKLCLQHMRASCVHDSKCFKGFWTSVRRSQLPPYFCVPIFCVSYYFCHCCDPNTWHKQRKGRKTYFACGFRRFNSPWGVKGLWQSREVHICGTRKAEKGNRVRSQDKIWSPKLGPTSYLSWSFNIRWLGQIPHDLVISGNALTDLARAVPHWSLRTSQPHQGDN
jgi:hypothetical protein